jgi:hypothetical protein
MIRAVSSYAILMFLTTFASNVSADRMATHKASVEVHALVIGVNTPLRRDQQQLRYADDDAVAFYRLFRALGNAELLTELDDDSRRLHTQFPRSAPPPTRANVRRAINRVLERIERAVRAGRKAELFFVYSGHGDVDSAGGYLALADGDRFASADLARLLARSRAHANHVIIDACKSYFLVYAKGVGGSRSRAKIGFHKRSGFAKRFVNTGFLLSTSSGASSHEWARYQAGIFSHEVRSALSGAADINGDGSVSYGEAAAFISKANAKIPNERFRPQIHATPPRGRAAQPIVRWTKNAKAHRVIVPGHIAGRYFVEDRRGVRVLDFHSAPSTQVSLWVTFKKRLYLHDLTRQLEYTIESDGPISKQAGRQRNYGVKGAAHEAFESIFSSPYSSGDHVRYLRKIASARRFQTATSASRRSRPTTTTAVAGPSNQLTVGYRMQTGYADQSSLLHGVSLELRRRIWRRLWLGGGASYGLALYQRQDGISVALHDGMLFGSMRWQTPSWHRIGLQFGVLLGGGVVYQRSTLGSAQSSATQWVVRYRGLAGVSIALTSSLSAVVEGGVGQDFVNKTGTKAEFSAQFAAKLQLGF